MKRVYAALFWILGTLSVLMIYGFASYLLASFGHATEPWGWWVRFNSDAVHIEPPIECLGFSNSHTLQVYNILIPFGCCNEVKVNSQDLVIPSYRGTNHSPCQRHNLTYIDNQVILEINDKVVVANDQNNRTLVFEVEHKNKTSVVSIPIYVQNGRLHKARNLLVIFSPSIAIIILFAVYLFRDRPETALVKKLRKVFFYIIIGIIIFLILVFILTLRKNIFAVMLIFLVVPFLILIFPFILLLLIITQIALWMRKEENKHLPKHKI